MPKFEVQVNRCKVCNKTVYPMEQLIADEIYYHKPCFRCSKCNRTLSTGTYASLEGAIYCKPHFLQLFKQKGNYEEGFGKARHKNKWNEKGKVEPTTNGKTAGTVESPDEAADKENFLPIVSNGSAYHREDSTDGGVEEERVPISLEFKKSRLQQAAVDSSKSAAQQHSPGKLGKWQPLTRSTSQETHKAAPKKLSVDWSSKVGKSEDSRRKFEEPAKFQELTSVKTKFESGEVGKKEFKSDVKDEVEQVLGENPGKTSSTKDKFESGELVKKEFNSEQRQEVDVLIKAGKEAAQEKRDQYQHSSHYESQSRQEVEAIAKVLPGAATDKKNKFESGELINKKFDSDVRKELEGFHPSRKASERKNQFENDEVDHVAYESEVRKEIEEFKNVRTASAKKEIYESGQIERDEAKDFDARKEIESLKASGNASNTKSKFEKGEYERVQVTSSVKQEIEQMKSSIDNSNKRSKYESGQLDPKDYESDARKELQTMKTGAGDLKTKYESGELTRQEYESAAKKELEGLKTGASDIKTKIETGEVERPEYEESQVKKDLEQVRRSAPGSSSVKSKYLHEVNEGNKVITSKPVEIEKAKPEEIRISDDAYEEARKVEEELSENENDGEYVAPPQPKKMTNIMDRFKKPEQQKETPQINKIQIPSFEKKQDSDEEMNGNDPITEADAEAMKEQLWSKKASNLKEMFESKNKIDNEPKSTPKPIDLDAEINAYQEHLKKNRPSKKPKPSKFAVKEHNAILPDSEMQSNGVQQEVSVEDTHRK